MTDLTVRTGPKTSTCDKSNTLLFEDVQKKKKKGKFIMRKETYIVYQYVSVDICTITRSLFNNLSSKSLAAGTSGFTVNMNMLREVWICFVSSQ